MTGLVKVQKDPSDPKENDKTEQTEPAGRHPGHRYQLLASDALVTNWFQISSHWLS